MSKSISRWEKFKRVVAHSFELETKAEIHERIEEIERTARRAEMEQRRAERMRELEMEYEQQLVEIQRKEALIRIRKQQEKEERIRKEEAERKHQEAIQLYKDNRRLQGVSIYSNQNDTVVEDTVDTE